jgi:hypothetical protein
LVRFFDGSGLGGGEAAADQRENHFRRNLRGLAGLDFLDGEIGILRRVDFRPHRISLGGRDFLEGRSGRLVAQKDHCQHDGKQEEHPKAPPEGAEADERIVAGLHGWKIG